MTELIYRGVRYTPEKPKHDGVVPILRYRGYEYDPRDAWRAARPIYTSRHTRVYRGVSSGDDGPGGNAFAAV